MEKTKEQLLKEIEELKAPQGYLYAGLPRFRGLFGRDSIIVAWQLLHYDPSIAKNTLKELAKLQGEKENDLTGEEPGKIPHEYYSKNVSDEWWEEYKSHYDWLERGKPNYMAADSTPFFLILLGKYFKETGDKETLNELWEEAQKAVNWILNYGDKDQNLFIEYERKGPSGLVHQCWKDRDENHLKIELPVEVVEIQGYQYLALLEVLQLEEVFDHKPFSEDLLERARELKEEFNEKFWWPEEEYYVFALDGNKNQVKEVASNPGHLLFTGILNDRGEKAVVKRLFKEDLWTPFGIRTHSEKSSQFSPSAYHFGSIWPHDNWVISQGLKEFGYNSEYDKIKKALLEAYRKLEKIPELYGVEENKLIEIKDTCHPQAWATGALFNLITS